MGLKEHMQDAELWEILSALREVLPAKTPDYFTPDNYNQIGDEMRAMAILLVLGATHHHAPEEFGKTLEIDVGDRFAEAVRGHCAEGVNMTIPEERVHQKTEVWWLIEAGSPCIYMAQHGWTTTDPWYTAHRFIAKKDAEEFLLKYKKHWDIEPGVGVHDWRICDHLFYV